MTDVKFTANGTEYTNATPGWSVQESATPVVPGQFADSTGLISATIRGGDDELLLIDEQSSAITPLGTIDGPIKSASQTGELGVSITQGTYLDQFDADFAVPANISGNLAAELYLMMQAAGLATLPNYLPNNAISGYSVPFIGSTYDPTGTVGFQTLFPSLVSYDDPYAIAPLGTQHYGVTIRDTFSGGSVLPLTSTGQDIYPGLEASAAVKVVFQWMLDLRGASNFRAEFAIGAGPNFPDYANEFGAFVNGATKTFFSRGGSSTSWASLDDSEPILVTLSLEPIFTTFQQYRERLTLTDHTGATVSVLVTNPNDYRYAKGGAGIQPYYYSFFGDQDIYMMNVYMIPDSASVDSSYIALDTSLPFDTSDYTPRQPTGAYPAVGGNLWQNIQALCSATNTEVYPTQNGFGVRDALSLPETSVANLSSQSMTIGRAQAGRNVEVVCNNAITVTGVVYSAFEEGDQPITVGFGETVVVTVGSSRVFPLGLVQPQKYTWSSPTPFTIPGTYTVVDSTGLQIVGNQWQDYGGRLDVALSQEVSGGIVVSVRGPDAEIPSTTAPYTIGLSDGQVVRPFLNIAGVAVVTNEDVITIPTGANPAVVKQDVATRVVNPFINSTSVAYDRGAWAAARANGVAPTVEISAGSKVTTYGDTAGSRFRHRNGVYRVGSSTLSGLGRSVSGERHYTVGDRDSVWGALDVGDYDAAWGSRPVKEHVVFPEKYNP